MKKPPVWFTWVCVAALLWNVAGMVAIAIDLKVALLDVSHLPASEQAMYASRPIWSVLASLLAVVGGTIGCIGLLTRRRWSMPLLLASMFGIIVQDAGLVLIVGLASLMDRSAMYMQSAVFLIALGLLLLAHRAGREGWLR